MTEIPFSAAELYKISDEQIKNGQGTVGNHTFSVASNRPSCHPLRPSLRLFYDFIKLLDQPKHMIYNKHVKILNTPKEGKSHGKIFKMYH